MKKLFAVIAVLAVMLSFAGCGGTKYEVSDYDTAATNDLVQLFIKQRTVTDETEAVTLTIENLTDKDYTYDAGQRLEIWQDGHWCVIPDKQDFVTMQLFTLPGNATDEVTFSFVNHYDKLGDGRYRIVMNFSSMDGSTVVRITLKSSPSGLSMVVEIRRGSFSSQPIMS